MGGRLKANAPIHPRSPDQISRNLFLCINDCLIRAKITSMSVTVPTMMIMTAQVSTY